MKLRSYFIGQKVIRLSRYFLWRRRLNLMVFNKQTLTYRVVVSAILIALGVGLAPFIYIPFLTAKAYPGQHMINAIAGVLLGPLWAAFIATIIGIIRNALGIGTIYAFPGGIPGGFVVGIFSYILKKVKPKVIEYAALTEPLGTVIIGGTLSVYIVAPLISDLKVSGALIPIWFLFGISSIPGSIIGFLILKVLKYVYKHTTLK